MKFKENFEKRFIPACGGGEQSASVDYKNYLENSHLLWVERVNSGEMLKLFVHTCENPPQILTSCTYFNILTNSVFKIFKKLIDKP